MAHSVNRQSREEAAPVKRPVGSLRPWRRLLARLPELSKAMGVEVPQGLLMQSFTHRSFSHEHPDAPNNERLEFLGDSVIQAIATIYLFNNFPDMPEREMTSLRMTAVREEGLAQMALDLSLDRCLLLGKGAGREGGRERKSLLCDAFEALVGAVFLSGGWEAAEKFAGPRLKKTMEANLKELGGANPYMDWKTTLAVLARSQNLGELSFSTSPDEENGGFDSECLLGSGEVLAKGRGGKKKAAEEEAARLACEALKKKSGGAKPELETHGKTDPSPF